jgi:hypothetical protein
MPIYPSSLAHLHNPSNELNGALSSINCAKKTAGPLIVFMVFIKIFKSYKLWFLINSNPTIIFFE